MKKIILLLILGVGLSVPGCGKKEVQTKKIEGKTGLETESATTQEVDTLTKKMDDLMEGVQQ
ncbi:MAG: hypothetical protein JSW33_11185 [bacterium]|nr:MAG: hypothetical protein JSW33_11185 [bacterium]